MCYAQRASEQMKEAETFREKMSSVQKWMIRLQLPHELRVKIRQYYAEASGHCSTLTKCAALHTHATDECMQHAPMHCVDAIWSHVHVLHVTVPRSIHRIILLCGLCRCGFIRLMSRKVFRCFKTYPSICMARWSGGEYRTSWTKCMRSR